MNTVVSEVGCLHFCSSFPSSAVLCHSTYHLLLPSPILKNSKHWFFLHIDALQTLYLISNLQTPKIAELFVLPRGEIPHRHLLHEPNWDSEIKYYKIQVM